MPTIQSVTLGTANQAGTITCSVPVNAGPNLLLLAAIHIETAVDDCTAMVRDGQNPVEHAVIAAGTWSRVELWKLVDPNLGTNTLTATVVGAGGDRGRLAVWVIEEADPDTPLRTAVTDWADSGQSSTIDAASVDLTDLLIDIITFDSTGHGSNPGLNQIEQYNIDNGASGSFELAGSSQNAEDGDAMSWDWSFTCPFSHIAVAVVHTIIPTQKIRPDGDIVTTGWSTAPLWSKIEEETPDGTIISGVAS